MDIENGSGIFIGFIAIILGFAVYIDKNRKKNNNNNPAHPHTNPHAKPGDDGG
ncbi:hypothetical protein J2S17_003475 [Cytobacillus purgationiresistens]|uniref:LPXTG cell wall anchor domain-containing protein n=1 Tax=Cytobacillus purgationiresistens TaxID=863449 RepID=A0ABU0AJZ0_9BACI|nr:hypothetical protein [Cytobacillus purgationiresistens]